MLGLGDLGTAIGYFGFLVFALQLTAFYRGYFFLEVLNFALGSAVLFVDIIGKFLDTEHITVVGNGNSLHAVFHGLVYQLTDAGLTIEQRILGMDV